MYLTTTSKLRIALQWRDDVEKPEMIHAINREGSYTNTHLSFKDTVSQQELDAICRAANVFYQIMGSKLRIGNSMGELIPATGVHNVQKSQTLT